MILVLVPEPLEAYNCPPKIATARLLVTVFETTVPPVAP